MNDFAVSIDVLNDIIVDPDFESVCPALTEDEFTLLEQNILSDGEVTSPLIVWNNRLIDGHHRRQIILKHPELPFQIKDIVLDNKYEAIAWICKNQVGRRNLTREQCMYLVGKRYAAEKGSATFNGNQHTLPKESGLVHFEPDQNAHGTRTKIAEDTKTSESYVMRADWYAQGVDAAEAACPGVKEELLSGALKPTKQEVISLSKLPVAEVANKLSEYRKAQEDRDKKRRQAREEKRRQAEETIETEKCFSSISELSANMAEPKRRNNVSNVLGIINNKAQELQAICETYIDEFPELMEADKPLLFQALDCMKEYLNELYKEV